MYDQVKKQQEPSYWLAFISRKPIANDFWNKIKATFLVKVICPSQGLIRGDNDDNRMDGRDLESGRRVQSRSLAWLHSIATRCGWQRASGCDVGLEKYAG